MLGLDGLGVEDNHELNILVLKRLNMRSVIFIFALSLIFSLFVNLAFAETKNDSIYFPPQLRDWLEWVEQRQPEYACPFVSENKKQCVWYTKLVLDVSETSGRFLLDVWLDKPSEVILPGGGNAGVVEASLMKKSSLNLYQENSKPVVFLPKWENQIEGSFKWNRMPDYIEIPQGVALVELKINGSKIDLLRKSAEDRIWLKQTKAEEKENIEDKVNVQISRKLVDAVPLLLETILHLEISGRSREIFLGKVLPLGFEPYAVSSQLGYSFSDKHELSIQAFAGSYEIQIKSAALNNVKNIQLPSRVNFDLVDFNKKEFWAFQADTILRTVAISGAKAVDASRTWVPSDWQSLPIYVLEDNAQITINETRRGEKENKLNDLNLDRSLYLDLDSIDWSVRDVINGELYNSWRLNANDILQLQSIQINGQKQVITRDPATNLQGLEIRSRKVSLDVAARVSSSFVFPAVIPASGWAHDLNSARLTINLPPGWNLLHVTGAEHSTNTWTSSWTLLDFFVVLLCAVAMFKLFSPVWGVVTITALVLSHDQNLAPFYVWFHLLAAVALLRVLPAGKLEKIVRTYFYCTIVFVSLLLAYYCIDEITTALFPQTGSIHQPSFYSPNSARAPQWKIGKTLPMKSKEAESLSIPSDEYNNALVAESSALGADVQTGVELDESDSNAQTQIGLETPNWSWKSWSFRWDSPVEKERMLSLYLLSPKMSLVVSLIRIIALLSLILPFVRSIKLPKANAVSVLLLCCACFSTSLSYAQTFPPKDLLDEVAKRLEQNRCRGVCTTALSSKLLIHGDDVVFETKVSSRETGVYRIPGTLDVMQIKSIELDSSPAAALSLQDKGSIAVRLTEGIHTLRVIASFGGKVSFDLVFFDSPGYLEVDADDWTIEGLNPFGMLQGNLRLNKKVEQSEAKAAKDRVANISLPVIAIIKRKLMLGVKWQLETTLSLLGNPNSAITLKVPLLDGESVFSPTVKQEGKFAIVSLPYGQTLISWNSAFLERNNFSLTAVESKEFVEHWTLACAQMWQCKISGLNPIRTTLSDKQNYEWRPWGGEKIDVSVIKPLAVEGILSSINNVKVSHYPGEQILRTEINFQTKSSINGQHTIILPLGAIIEYFKVNGEDSPIDYVDSKLQAPIHVGQTDIALAFKLSESISMYQRFPEVKLGLPASNIETSIHYPKNRWLLLCGGDAWGPVVLFWVYLVFILIFAYLLSYIPNSPLSFLQWGLLSLGLLRLPIYLAIIPVFTFFAFAYRKQVTLESRQAFNLGQIILTILTYYSLRLFYSAIYLGLIIAPNMNIKGNHSIDSMLNWYVDFAFENLTSPWLISVPTYVYHIIMMFWSLWLALSLVSWAPWAWQCFSKNGFWKSKNRLIDV